LLDPHAANVRTAIDSSANNRFDIYILLELFPLQHVRCFRSSHLSFAVVNASGQKARFHAAIGLGLTAIGDTMSGSRNRVKRSVSGFQGLTSPNCPRAVDRFWDEVNRYFQEGFIAPERA
jgi:hypothetical protein